MIVGVLGASGFIGTHLIAALNERGDVVKTASLRDPEAAAKELAQCDAVVNLSGEPVAQRWSTEVKQRILHSRTTAPRAFLNALSARNATVGTYVSASAIGYYGTSETVTFTEESPAGTDFLAEVCGAWERDAMRAQELGMRVAIVRTGIALGTDGGALQKILPPFRLGAGGRVGSGKQWYSWVHIDDVIGIYLMALDGVGGVLNATAPGAVRNSEFTKILGSVLHRPTFFPVPQAALAAMLGEGAFVVTEGQHVLPERTQAAGYTFKYNSLEPALRDLLR